MPIAPGLLCMLASCCIEFLEFIGVMRYFVSSLSVYSRVSKVSSNLPNVFHNLFYLSVIVFAFFFWFGLLYFALLCFVSFRFILLCFVSFVNKLIFIINLYYALILGSTTYIPVTAIREVHILAIFSLPSNTELSKLKFTRMLAM